MDEPTRLRLEALKVAAQAKPGASPQAVIKAAAEFLQWVLSGAMPEAPADPILPFNKGTPPINTARPRTIKEMVVVVLDAAGSGGLTALQILDEIQRRWWPSLNRTSLSPQLSRLKGDGVITYIAGTYRLPNVVSLFGPELPSGENTTMSS